MERQAVVIGAGPAGLAAAHELARRGTPPLVFERSDAVGGIARTERYKGFRFDIGGHRFFTRSPEVRQLWDEMLGDDFLSVRRLSRIFYRGRFFRYPLDPLNTFRNLGPAESARIVLSYVRARLRPLPREDTFEQWVVNRFGTRLYRTFFKTYTEKVWGIPCARIAADWAAQRIAGLSVTEALRSALLRTHRSKTLIREFQYPRLGPGMMWDRFRRAITEDGGDVQTGREVLRLHHRDGRVHRLDVRTTEGDIEVRADAVLSSMPLPRLIERLRPAPPDDVLRAAAALSHRSFLLVSLILDRPGLFPDQWIYVHDPAFQVGRVQNFSNWSAALVPDPGKSCLGMEYFCDEGDELWRTRDGDLVRLAADELRRLGLGDGAEVEDGVVVRQPDAYPVYDLGYQQHLAVVRPFLDGFENLQAIGRNGMHRYNNQDHSMLTGILAARNILGEHHDLWAVNADRAFAERPSAAPRPGETRARER
jgi:protoporphyrinogen oxidase